MNVRKLGAWMMGVAIAFSPISSAQATVSHVRVDDCWIFQTLVDGLDAYTPAFNIPLNGTRYVGRLEGVLSAKWTTTVNHYGTPGVPNYNEVYTNTWVNEPNKPSTADRHYFKPKDGEAVVQLSVIVTVGADGAVHGVPQGTYFCKKKFPSQAK